MQEPRRLTGESASILGFSLKRQRHLVSRVITLDRKHFRVRPAIHPIKQQKISASCSKEPVAWQSFNMIRAKVLPAQRIAPPRREIPELCGKTTCGRRLAGGCSAAGEARARASATKCCRGDPVYSGRPRGTHGPDTLLVRGKARILSLHRFPEHCRTSPGNLLRPRATALTKAFLL